MRRRRTSMSRGAASNRPSSLSRRRSTGIPLKAEAAIATLKAQVAELVVKSPTAAQVYHTDADPGEYVSPGVPLLTLIDLSDVWVRFDLREDLVKGLKIGDRFDVHVPALGDK